MLAGDGEHAFKGADDSLTFHLARSLQKFKEEGAFRRGVARASALTKGVCPEIVSANIISRAMIAKQCQS